jgi:hypothetical protein
MDTETVLQIIRILDRRINMPEHAHTTVSDTGFIILLRDHLQSFIETKLSIVENKTGE